MYQRFHHKEKISQVLSKVRSQYFIQCYITSSFIETVPQVSFIKLLQMLLQKKQQNSKIAEFLEKIASIYYGNSQGDVKKSVSNTSMKQQM